MYLLNYITIKILLVLNFKQKYKLHLWHICLSFIIIYGCWYFTFVFNTKHDSMSFFKEWD